ncbi:hypothetical protein Q604_UNBc4C00286G0001, partial [human gut metagenome]
CILNMWLIKESFKCYNIIEILGGLEYSIFNQVIHQGIL